MASFNQLTSVPPTAAEKAAASARWERRGLLGRLVLLPATTPAEQAEPARIRIAAR